MTVRALVTGLLATAVLAAVAFFNDMVIRNTQLIGNYLPMSVFGLLILAVLPANVLWHRFRGRVLFTPRELAVVLGIVLFACCIPGRSLMHLFTNQLMMPHHHVQTEVSWGNVLEQIPLTEDHPYGRRLLFIDSETYNIPLALNFDHDDQLWRVMYQMYEWPWEGSAPDDAEPGDTVPRWRAGVATNVKNGDATHFWSNATELPETKRFAIKRRFNVSNLSGGR